MSVVTGLSKIEVTREAEKMFRKSATVITDGRRCYSGLQDICKSHKIVIVAIKKKWQKYFHGYLQLLVMLKRNC